MSTKDLKYILIKNSKDFLIYLIRQSCEDREEEELILKEYLPKFESKISKIKNTNYNKVISSNTFQYKKSKLYFIESKKGLECIDEYNKNIKNTESKELQIKRITKYLSTLIIDLGFMLYPRGYNLIRSKFNDIIKGLELEINEIDFIFYYHDIAAKYGEKIDYGLNIIYSYKDLLEKIKDFSFDDWNKRRAQADVMITVNYFTEKYTKLNTDQVRTLEFFEEYFKLTVGFLEKGAEELFKLIEDNNIKFN